DHLNQIVFQPGLTGTIRLTQGPLSVSKELVIDGPGQDLLTVSGNGQSGVLYITQSAHTVFVADLTIADGTGFNVDGKIYGGGIYADVTFGASVTLTNVTVAGNSTPGQGDSFGGGIYKAAGTLTLVSSTGAHNRVGGGGINQRGGGIYNASGTLTLISSTVAGKQVGRGGDGSCNWGGGIYNEATPDAPGGRLSGHNGCR